MGARCGKQTKWKILVAGRKRRCICTKCLDTKFNECKYPKFTHGTPKDWFEIKKPEYTEQKDESILVVDTDTDECDATTTHNHGLQKEEHSVKRTLGIEATADGKSNCEILWCGYLDKQFGPIFGDTTFEDFSRDTDFVPTTKNLHLQTDIIGWKVWLKGYKQGRQGKTGIVGGSKAKLYVVESFDSKSNCHMLTNPKDDYDRKYMYMGPLPITEEQQKMIKIVNII